jgi:hypothetical protein
MSQTGTINPNTWYPHTHALPAPISVSVFSISEEYFIFLVPQAKKFAVIFNHLSLSLSLPIFNEPSILSAQIVPSIMNLVTSHHL